MKTLLLAGYGDIARRHGTALDRPEMLAVLPAALAKARILPARFVHVSTSGVYGDGVPHRVPA